MLIAELKEKKEVENIKDFKTTTYIQIKSWISFAKKQLICENVVDNCLEYDDDILLCNYFTKKLLLDMSLVTFYTNLEFSDDNSLEEYDFLCENGIMKYIIEEIDREEYWFITETIDEIVEQKIKIHNSIENMINKGINVLIQKLPTNKELKSLIKSTIKDINKLDVDKLPMVKQLLDVAQGKL